MADQPMVKVQIENQTSSVLIVRSSFCHNLPPGGVLNVQIQKGFRFRILCGPTAIFSCHAWKDTEHTIHQIYNEQPHAAVRLVNNCPHPVSAKFEEKSQLLDGGSQKEILVNVRHEIVIHSIVSESPRVLCTDEKTDLKFDQEQFLKSNTITIPEKVFYPDGTGMLKNYSSLFPQSTHGQNQATSRAGTGNGVDTESGGPESRNGVDSASEREQGDRKLKAAETTKPMDQGHGGNGEVKEGMGAAAASSSGLAGATSGKDNSRGGGGSSNAGATAATEEQPIQAPRKESTNPLTRANKPAQSQTHKKEETPTQNPTGKPAFQTKANAVPTNEAAIHEKSTSTNIQTQEAATKRGHVPPSSSNAGSSTVSVATTSMSSNQGSSHVQLNNETSKPAAKSSQQDVSTGHQEAAKWFLNSNRSNKSYDVHPERYVFPSKGAAAIPPAEKSGTPGQKPTSKPTQVPKIKPATKAGNSMSVQQNKSSEEGETKKDTLHSMPEMRSATGATGVPFSAIPKKTEQLDADSKDSTSATAVMGFSPALDKKFPPATHSTSSKGASGPSQKGLHAVENSPAKKPTASAGNNTSFFATDGTVQQNKSRDEGISTELTGDIAKQNNSALAEPQVFPANKKGQATVVDPADDGTSKETDNALNDESNDKPPISAKSVSVPPVPSTAPVVPVAENAFADLPGSSNTNQTMPTNNGQQTKAPINGQPTKASKPSFEASMEPNTTPTPATKPTNDKATSGKPKSGEDAGRSSSNPPEENSIPGSAVARKVDEAPGVVSETQTQSPEAAISGSKRNRSSKNVSSDEPPPKKRKKDAMKSNQPSANTSPARGKEATITNPNNAGNLVTNASGTKDTTNQSKRRPSNQNEYFAPVSKRAKTSNETPEVEHETSTSSSQSDQDASTPTVGDQADGNDTLARGNDIQEDSSNTKPMEDGEEATKGTEARSGRAVNSNTPLGHQQKKAGASTATSQSMTATTLRSSQAEKSEGTKHTVEKTTPNPEGVRNKVVDTAGSEGNERLGTLSQSEKERLLPDKENAAIKKVPNSKERPGATKTTGHSSFSIKDTNKVASTNIQQDEVQRDDSEDDSGADERFRGRNNKELTDLMDMLQDFSDTEDEPPLEGDKRDAVDKSHDPRIILDSVSRNCSYLHYKGNVPFPPKFSGSRFSLYVKMNPDDPNDEPKWVPDFEFTRNNNDDKRIEIIAEYAENTEVAKLHVGGNLNGRPVTAKGPGDTTIVTKTKLSKKAECRYFIAHNPDSDLASDNKEALAAGDTNRLATYCTERLRGPRNKKSGWKPVFRKDFKELGNFMCSNSTGRFCVGDSFTPIIMKLYPELFPNANDPHGVVPNTAQFEGRRKLTALVRYALSPDGTHVGNYELVRFVHQFRYPGTQKPMFDIAILNDDYCKNKRAILNLPATKRRRVGTTDVYDLPKELCPVYLITTNTFWVPGQNTSTEKAPAGQSHASNIFAEVVESEEPGGPPRILTHFFDNEARARVMEIEESDKETAANARIVFDDHFDLASKIVLQEQFSIYRHGEIPESMRSKLLWAQAPKEGQDGQEWLDNEYVALPVTDYDWNGQGFVLKPDKAFKPFKIKYGPKGGEVLGKMPGEEIRIRVPLPASHYRWDGQDFVLKLGKDDDPRLDYGPNREVLRSKTVIKFHGVELRVSEYDWDGQHFVLKADKAFMPNKIKYGLNREVLGSVPEDEIKITMSLPVKEYDWDGKDFILKPGKEKRPRLVYGPKGEVTGEKKKTRKRAGGGGRGGGGGQHDNKKNKK